VKILLVHNQYQQPGGEDVVFEQERQLLERAGHQVVVYQRSNLEIEDRSLGQRLILAKNIVSAADTKRELTGLLVREKPQLVHIHNTFVMVSPSVYSTCQEANIPVLQTLHNYRLLCPAASLFRDGHICEECMEHSLWRSVRYGCYRGSRSATAAVALMLAVHRNRHTFERKVNGYIALTEFARAKLVAGGLPAERIFVKPNFVYPDPGPRRGAREYVVFAGRLSPEKRVSTLLAAWERLENRISLRVLGDGPERQALQLRAARGGLSSVSFLGHLSRQETWTTIGKARCLIMPSECYETFNLTIAEAFACGTPVICSRLGAMREIVEDGRTGLHFTPGDPDDLAAKVEWAWTHPAEMRAMEADARREYEAKYTAEQNYRTLADIYGQTLRAEALFRLGALRAERKRFAPVSHAAGLLGKAYAYVVATLQELAHLPVRLAGGGDFLPGLGSSMRARGSRLGKRLAWFAVRLVGAPLYRLQLTAVRLLGKLCGVASSSEMDLSRVRRVLVVRVDAIGDLVMTTPFLRELRRNLPNASIVLVVNAQLGGLVKHCPYVDEVLSFDCLIPAYWKPFLLPWRALRMAMTEFWPRRFDLAVLPRRELDLWYASFLAFFSRAPIRVTYTEFVNRRKHQAHPGFNLLFTHLVTNRPGSMHEVEHNLDILRYLGASIRDDRMELWMSRECETLACEVLGNGGVRDGDLLIGLCPGASNTLKQWPIERFCEVAARLRDRHNCKIVIVGGPGDAPLGKKVEAALGTGVVNLAGATSLEQTAAVIKRCSLFISNDTGPMHIAAAVGTPVVAIFGSSCEHRFGPWKGHTIVSTDLPCRPCERGHVLDRCMYCIYDAPRCLLEVAAESVLDQANQALNKVVGSMPVAPSN
jgi:ADP-heptose:LPS heptosyltransferase